MSMRDFLTRLSASSDTGQELRKAQAEKIAIQESQQKLSAGQMGNSKLSDYIGGSNPQAESQVRNQIFNAPVGPLTQDQQSASDVITSQKSGINPVYRNMTFNQAKEIAPFITANANETKVETPKKTIWVNINDKTDQYQAGPNDWKKGYVPIERFNDMNPKSDINIGEKEQQQQDKLEEQARNRIVGIRGDMSLKNVEAQRDAAITAYNRIKQVRDAGTQLNPIDYVDVLGQLYKARTGSAPTNEVLSQARQETAKGNLAKAYTYFTGNQAPATTQDIMNSLQEMALHMGQQADQLHDSYMGPHMDMPTRLESNRANALKKLSRGITFADATGTGNQPKTSVTSPKIGDIENGFRYKGGNPSDSANWVQMPGQAQ